MTVLPNGMPVKSTMTSKRSPGAISRLVFCAGAGRSPPSDPMTQKGRSLPALHVEVQVVEAGLRAVQEAEPVSPRLGIQVGIGLAVDHRRVTEELRNPYRVNSADAFRRDRTGCHRR